MLRSGETPIYRTDALVRRSQPLQKSTDGKQAFASMNASVLATIGASEGDAVTIDQGGARAVLPAKLDESIPDGTVWVPAGLYETRTLGHVFSEVTVTKGGELPGEPAITAVPGGAGRQVKEVV